jgi:hypothetical protein
MALDDVLERLKLEGEQPDAWLALLDALINDAEGINIKESLLERIKGDEGELYPRAMVAVQLCHRIPTCFMQLSDFIRQSLLQLHERDTGELFTLLTCALQSVIKYFYGTDGSVELFAELTFLRDTAVECIEKKRKHAGVVIRGGRFLQLLASCWSRPALGEVTPTELSLADHPKEHAVRTSALREEGSKTLDRLIGLIWGQEAIPLPAMLALINLMGRLARERPIFLPKIIPALVDLFELPPSRLAEHQVVFLSHTLERQLASLVESAAAEKYYSLIVEVLRKGSSQKGRKRETPAKAKEEEEEEDAELAMVGTKRLKTETASIDTSTVPLHVAVEVVLSTLRKLATEQLKSSLERWRPTPMTRDPRRATEAAAEIAEPAKEDQMVPFELAPRELSLTEASNLLLAQFRAILTGMYDVTLIPKADKRAARVKALIRLAAVLDDAGIVAPREALLQYCLEHLDERLDILLYWLRLLWIKDNGRPTMIPAKDGAYEEACSAVLAHLQELPPQWDEQLVRFLGEAPRLIGDLHVVLIDGLSREPLTRQAALSVAVKLAVQRPAARAELVTLLLSYCQDEDETMRKATLPLVCDKLIPVANSIITETAFKLAHSDERCGIHVDLPLRLAIYQPNLFGHFLNLFASTCHEYITTQVPIICTWLDGENMKSGLSMALTESNIDETPAGIIVERLVEALCRTSMRRVIWMRF